MHKRDKKTAKKHLFGCLFSIEIRTLSPIISLKCADFFVLMGIVGFWLSGERGGVELGRPMGRRGEDNVEGTGWRKKDIARW